MASIITADNGVVSGSAGIKQSADSSGILALATGTGTTAVTIDASQNVGIGTSSPASGSGGGLSLGTTSAGKSIHLYSSTYAGNGLANFYGTDGAVKLQMGSSGSTSAFVYGNAGVLQLGGNGSETMRIDSSGNLLVGTTSTDNGRMCVEAQTNGTAISFRRNTGAYGSNTKVGQIVCDSTSTSYVTSSDYRLKENITPMTGALSVVAALNPVTYTWKSNGESTHGFIAHELQAVVPEAVVGEKDAVDADGNPVYQGIDTSFLVATLTAAIQEQQALITTLTERITALEAK